MKLLFQNSQNKERAIAEVNNWKDVWGEINKFLEDHNFKSYYSRVWENNGRLMIDVGSWSEFFIVEGCSFEDFQNEHRKED